jgi:hypothetical protein
MVAAVSVAFVWSLARPPRNDPHAGMSGRWAGIGIGLLAIWLGVPAIAASSGLLADFSSLPPKMGILLVALVIGTTIVALTSVGSRILATTGVAGLLGFQVFRVPVELWLHRLYGEGVAPVQMTYSGYNFDIVSGLVCGAVGLWALAGRPPRWAVVGANVIGTILLVNIVTIAVLSMPTPVRMFLNDPPNTFVAYFPFVWLASLLVQAAWFGHLLVGRAVVRDLHAGSRG